MDKVHIVIEMDKDDYEKVLVAYGYDDVESSNLGSSCYYAIRSGTPLPKGHWIDGVCSECGYIGDEEVFGGKFKYCPVCGAVMRGEHEND